MTQDVVAYARLRDPITGLERVDCIGRSDGAVIPADTANGDWNAYLAWIGKGHEPDPAPPLPPIDLAAYVAARLASARDGGMTLGGMRIKTDAESRGLIDGAGALCQLDPDAAIDFKAASGWVKLDAPTMRAVALAVGRWVQACYSTYRTVSDAIEAGTITDAAQIDAAFAALERPE